MPVVHGVENRKPFAVIAVCIGRQLMFHVVRLEILGFARLYNAVLGKRSSPHYIAPRLNILRIFAGFTSDSEMDEERIAALLDALKCVRKTAEKCGVTLALETHGGVAPGGAPGTVRHFASVSTRIDTLDRILQTGVSLLYDPANLNAAGVHEPEQFFARYSSRVADVHLKDFRAVPGGLVPCACGQGGLDWKKLMHALKDYSGPALIEYELPGDVERDMRESLDFLRSWGA